MYSVKNEVQADRQGQVSAALGASFYDAESLLAELRDFAGTLDPVLSPTLPGGATNNKPGYDCPLAQKIDSLGELIRQARAVVGDLRTRLEL